MAGPRLLPWLGQLLRLEWRALVSGTVVLLVGACAALAYTEQAVREAVERLMRGRTTIVIAHRCVGRMNCVP